MKHKFPRPQKQNRTASPLFLKLARAIAEMRLRTQSIIFAVRALKIPSFKLSRPKIRLPQVTRPRFHLPQIKMPSIKRPTIKLPSIKIPVLTLPAIKLPAVKLPVIKRPTLKFPALSLPKWKPVIGLRTIRMAGGIAICICALLLIGGGLNIVTNHPVLASGFSPMDFMKNNPLLKMTQKNDELTDPEFLNSILPAAGQEASAANESEDNGRYRYSVEEDTLDVEAVLIPHDTTVISSSRDSKIKSINFDNGETFKKGEILVEYTCDDARAEVEIAQTQRQLTAQKKSASHKLFKLDIISNLEKLELESEDKQAEARAALHKSRMGDCFIRAEYDGRVVKRLANAGEFTRTDRVLMEVASLEYLKAEFLLPSRWLRWVNVGAPIAITLNETDEIYTAVVEHIYGEVDPASQSIQVTAQLDPYEDPLLPGMSGQTTIDVQAIRDAGVFGFLEPKPAD